MDATPQQIDVGGGRFPWDAEGVIDRLTTLWVDEGKSASQIAADLTATVGVGISRNAVMGKVNRLGLVGKGNPERASGAHESDREITSPPQSGSQNSGAPVAEPLRETGPAPTNEAAPEPVVEPVEQLPFAAPAAQPAGVGLFEARDSQCRWPIGEPSSPDFRFCGEPRESPRWSWCAAHMAMGFDQRSSSRRRAEWERAQKLRTGKAKAA